MNIFQQPQILMRLITYGILFTVFFFLSLSNIQIWFLFIILMLVLFFLETFIFTHKFNHKKETNNELKNLLFYQSPSMIVNIDIKTWEILEINDILSSILNVSNPYQMIGKPIFNLFSDIENKTLSKALHTLLRKGILHQFSTEIVTLEGNTIQVVLDGIISEKGNEAYIYITNISGIKKIESNLKANKNLLQNIIDKTLEAVIITNETGKIIDWNPQAEKLIGHCKNNVINKSISEVLRSKDEMFLSLKKDIVNYLKNQETKYIGRRERFNIISNTNKNIPIESCCFPVLSENGYVFCLFLHDITNELNARAYELKLASIIKQTEDAIITLDQNFNIDSWNKGASEIFDYKENEVMGKEVFSFLSKGHSKLLRKKLSYILESSENFQYQFSKKQNSIKSKYFLANLNLIKYSKTTFGISIIIRDITDIKNREAVIRNLMRELEMSNKELQSFAYVASHDLKEPLRGIKNYAMILKDEYTQILDDSGTSFLDSLINSCTRLERLLESLLQYSKVGNLKLHLELLDPNEILTEVSDSIHHIIKQKNATLNIENALPKVLADKSRLEEIFMNLITNGLKYNDKPSPTIEIGFSSKYSTDKIVCLFVKDNGIGIQKEKVNDIFQIFQRLHKKDQYGGGAGAGLTITKRMIERHQGQIWIDSVPGKGSIFYFTLLNDNNANPDQNLNQTDGLLIRTKQEGQNETNQDTTHR